MYYDKFFPFYVSYADQIFWDQERQQETEISLMKSYYPETARKIQQKVEAECDLLDYEGSRLYDEYPDRWMLRQMCRTIKTMFEAETKAQGIADAFLDELIEVLLYQEISRRRCRKKRCRRYF